MKKGRFSKFMLIGLILFCLSNCAKTTSASTTIVTVSTGNRRIGDLLSMKIDYSIKVDVSHPETIKKGADSSWTVDVQGQEAVFTIIVEDEVPLIGGQTFSVSNQIVIGQEKTIPVTPGLSIVFSTELFTPIEISNSGQVDIQKLEWKTQSSKSFKVSVSETAKSGDVIRIEFPFSVILYASVIFDLTLFTHDVGKFTIGTFDVNPVIVETMNVGSSLNLYLIGALIIIPILGASSYLIYQKRTPKKKFCGKCGAKINLKKKFCGKCGERIK